MRTDDPDIANDIKAEASLLRETIRLTALGVSAGGSDNIFRDIVKYLAAALNVEHAFIGVLEPESKDSVHIIAGYFFRQFDDGFSYDLKDTPCENVIGQQYRYYPENVQDMFSDPHIKELETEGYAGIPLFDSKGEVLGLMAVANPEPLRDRELTENLLQIFSVRTAIELERRNAEKARNEKENELHRSEHRLRTTVDSSIDSVIALDSDGCILEYNPAAEQCFGYKKVDVIGQFLSPLIIPERYRKQFEQGMARFRDTGKGAFLGHQIETILMRSDGSEFPAEMAIDVMPGVDSEILIGYIRDITERREAENQRHQLEKQLQQAQKMEAIGQLTGGIAHDFNNILTAMMGYMSLAEEHSKTKTDEKLIKYLDRAQKSGKRARDLIQQMLTFSRGQHGEPRALLLAPLLNEWIGLLESTLPSSIEIETELDAEAATVMFDPVQIEQILMNLCINARDAMEGKGTLTVSLRQVKNIDCFCASCRQRVAGDFIEISVSDTGCGIPPEVQDHIFEPFYSTKEVGQGSGMGLSMVHGLVHEHDGHIMFGPASANGTSLRILLKPLDTKTDTIHVKDRLEPQHNEKFNNAQVLLVDDEPAVSEFMQDLLENWGLGVSVFNSSIEACEAFSGSMDQFDLVILDQTMPKMTGMALAEQLLKLRPDLPVILYTGYNAEISETQVKALGIRALVKKPVDTARLHNLINGLLVENQA